MKHYIIPIFIPHYGCTHACVFCNQKKITGQALPVSLEEVTSIIEEHLQRITQERYIEVAFYGGSFTALPMQVQQQLLQPAYEAWKQGKINAIRLSTRPDCITKEIVDHLISYGVSTIELGVQSLDNKVLEASARGHTAEDVVKGVNIIQKAGITCGIQIMPGLPREDLNSLIQTAQGIIRLKPDFVRVYPTVVISQTELASMYHVGSYIPLSMEEGVRRAAYLKLLFARQSIPVIRTGLQATEDLGNDEIVLAGPYHPAFGEMVDSYLFYGMLVQFFEKVSFHHRSIIIIRHHTRDTSKVRGLKNSNIKKLQEKYGLKNFIIQGDGTKLDELSIEYENISYVINKKMLADI